jgi:hypothetical protein
MIGSKVQRSDKWNWGGVDLNNGNPGYGYISECVADGWAEIEWDNGKKGLYHIGFNNIFDLYSSEGEPPKIHGFGMKKYFYFLYIFTWQ